MGGWKLGNGGDEVGVCVGGGGARAAAERRNNKIINHVLHDPSRTESLAVVSA